MPPAFALSQDQTLRFITPDIPARYSRKLTQIPDTTNATSHPYPKTIQAASASPDNTHRNNPKAVTAAPPTHPTPLSLKGNQDTQHPPTKSPHKTGTTSKRQKRTSNTDANVNEQRSLVWRIRRRSSLQIRTASRPCRVRSAHHRADQCSLVACAIHCQGLAFQRPGDRRPGAVVGRRPSMAGRSGCQTPFFSFPRERFISSRNRTLQRC